MKKKKELDNILIELIPKIKSYIRNFIRDENTVDDILQETLISALAKFPDSRQPFNIPGWLMTIAKNKSLNYLKKQKKTVGFKNIPDKYFLSESDISLENEDENKLMNSLNYLSASQKYILQMKYFTHHSIKEIGKLFKIPEGTVKRRLFDARKKLKEEMKMNREEKKVKRNAPKIQIIPKKESNIKFVKKLGYGLCFGAPLAGIGDVEICDAFVYPGRIFEYRVKSKVTRKAIMLGSEVWETINEYEQRKGEHSRYLYYTFDKKKISMPFRIMNFSPKLRVDIDQKELVKPSELELKTGVFNEPEKDNGIRVVDVVDLKIGNKLFKDVIRQRNSFDDYHGRCYGEEFYSSEGREILQRDYIGKNWKMGGFVTWEKWRDAPEIEFKGEKFRMWFEFILTDNYREK